MFLANHSYIALPTPQLQQLEQNLKFEFSLTGEDGKELDPVFGPGLTGLRNLGNRRGAIYFEKVSKY
jgi:uncharacterized UBP type Zn finger protein